MLNTMQTVHQLTQVTQDTLKIKDINPIIENAMNTNTKNHDFFSVKGDGYVVSMNVESIEDEDFIFEQVSDMKILLVRHGETNYNKIN